MEVKLQKWGNSWGIRIPNAFMKSIGLEGNNAVDLSCDENKIIITKSKKQKISLKELFDNYQGENLAKEFDWDEPKGREIW